MDFWEQLASALREDANVDELKSKFEAYKQEQLNGVIANKDKILGEKKELQAELETMKKQFQPFVENEITYEMFNELQVENESLKKNSDSPEDMKEKEKFVLEQGKNLKEKELRPEIEKLQKELDAVQGDREQYRNRYQQYRVQKEVVGMLKDMGVEYDDLWLDGLLAKSKFDYNDIEDKLEIELYAPENKSTVPIEDWKKIFPNSTQGKKMIKAPKNVGGSARGGVGIDGNKKLEPKDIYSGMFN